MARRTAFPFSAPTYAGVIALLGPESGAAAVTLLSQLALVACAWQLARRLMSLPLALIAIATLIALPGFYGADRVFTYIEPFLTPRMLAEALVLGSLAAESCERTRAAIALLAAALLIHPLMAAAGIAALLWKHIGIPHPRMTVLLVIAATLGLATPFIRIAPRPVGPFRRGVVAAGRGPYALSLRPELAKRRLGTSGYPTCHTGRRDRGCWPRSERAVCPGWRY